MTTVNVPVPPAGRISQESQLEYLKKEQACFLQAWTVHGICGRDHGRCLVVAILSVPQGLEQENHRVLGAGYQGDSKASHDLDLANCPYRHTRGYDYKDEIHLRARFTHFLNDHLLTQRMFLLMSPPSYPPYELSQLNCQ